MNARLSPAREAEIRGIAKVIPDCTYAELLREIDALRAELDDARKQLKLYIRTLLLPES